MATPSGSIQQGSISVTAGTLPVPDANGNFVWNIDTLPQGTYDFYFRTRAQIPGSFIQPAAQAEMMYDAAVRGNSPGARIEVSR